LESSAGELLQFMLSCCVVL